MLGVRTLAAAAARTVRDVVKSMMVVSEGAKVGYLSSPTSASFIPHSLSWLIIQAFESMGRRSTAVYTLRSSLVPLPRACLSELFVRKPRLGLLRAWAGGRSAARALDA